MLLLDLKDPLARRREFAGGRAARLATLLQRGHAVPPGFVVTMRAQRLVRRDATRLPGALEHAMRSAYAAYPPGTSFAVRAAPCLDEAVHAPAALNRLGVEHVLEAVATCLRVAGDAPTAVLIQSMTHSEVTARSVRVPGADGTLDALTVTAGFGLCLPASVGDDELDVYRSDCGTGMPFCVQTGRKSHRVIAVRGGVAREAVDPQRAAQPCLAVDRIVELRHEHARIETLFAFPQRVTWSFARGRLHVIDVEPIGTVAPRWARLELAALPPTVSLLAWDLAQGAVQAALTEAVLRLGAPRLAQPWLRREESAIEVNVAVLDLYAHFHARSSADYAGDSEANGPLSVAALAVDFAALAATPAELPDVVAGDPQAVWAWITSMAQAASVRLRLDVAIELAAHAATQRLAAALRGESPDRCRRLVDLMTAGTVTAEALAEAELEALERLPAAHHDDLIATCERVRRTSALAVLARSARAGLIGALDQALSHLADALVSAGRMENTAALRALSAEAVDALVAVRTGDCPTRTRSGLG